jgi:hypothetical protein
MGKNETSCGKQLERELSVGGRKLMAGGVAIREFQLRDIMPQLQQACKKVLRNPKTTPCREQDSH